MLPPRAISTASALKKASMVKISRGLMFFESRRMTALPDSLASRIRSASTAGIVPFPGRAMPSASARQFMLLAVNRPAQEPQPGQACASYSPSSASFSRPSLNAATPSNTESRPTARPFIRPASIGPPLTITDGMLSRAAAISMPGVILSQLVTRTSASSWWASAMVSIESAMSSRLGRE